MFGGLSKIIGGAAQGAIGGLAGGPGGALTGGVLGGIGGAASDGAASPTGGGSLDALTEQAKAVKIENAKKEVENGMEKQIVDTQANMAKAWAQ
jgi:hypothetical protein